MRGSGGGRNNARRVTDRIKTLGIGGIENILRGEKRKNE